MPQCVCGHRTGDRDVKRRLFQGRTETLFRVFFLEGEAAAREQPG